MSTGHLQKRSLCLQCLRDIFAEIKELHPDFRSCFRRYNKIIAVGLFPEAKFCDENADLMIGLHSRCAGDITELHMFIHLIRRTPGQGFLAQYRFKQPDTPPECVTYMLTESDHVSRHAGLSSSHPTKTLSNWKKLILIKAEQFLNIQARRLDSNMRLGTDISMKVVMIERLRFPEDITSLILEKFFE